ncbi:hypothetical protein A1QC_01150 [Vibrio rumoiensis 1S-45]|uniref:Bacterial surface antigen (D15) domain-containing protein n=2 Tax=Vibrio rumoiensis TaxID=76258 RepID=A0A1E5E2R2_9VIBR|nr:hypothetical protein A1QC_01150 [Vibrio rumoiensis 1S-45]
MRHLLGLLGLVSMPAFAVVPLFPQIPEHDMPKVDGILNGLGAGGDYDSSKAIDFSVLPGPFYTPEKKFGIGVSAVGLYHTASDADLSHQPSNITINSFVSSNLSVGVTLNNTTFLNDGQQRFELLAKYLNAPDVYYGKGYDAGQNDDNKHDFLNKTFQFAPKYSFKLRPNLLFGLGFDYQSVSASNVEMNDVPVTKSNELTNNQALGLTMNLTYDTRDYILNPYSGWLLQLDAGYYSDMLGDNEFSTYTTTVSNYIDLQPIPGVLAWQVKGEFTHGDVPWNYLPEVGGANNLRGYIEGRYRDNQVVYTQVEYRLPLFGRVGMVTWIGAATSADQLDGLGEDALMSYGVGYRFRVKDRVNLRLDFAIGENESMTYFNVNESF